MKKKESYRVPENYFESLQSRLSALPDAKAQPSRPWRSAFALAASIAVLFVLGSAFMKTVTPSSEDIASQTLYEEHEAFAQLLHRPGSYAFAMYEEMILENEENAVSPEDAILVNFLKENDNDW